MILARDAAPRPLAPPINADRRLRGPYTAAGAIAGALVPTATALWPGLVAQYDIELRTVAPDLGIPARRESLAARIPRAERILVPAAQRTLRIANGFADFVAGHLENLEAGQKKATPSFCLTVYNLDQADPADRELLDVLVRRLGNDRLVIEIAPYGHGTPPKTHDRKQSTVEQSPRRIQEHLAGGKQHPTETTHALSSSKDNAWRNTPKPSTSSSDPAQGPSDEAATRHLPGSLTTAENADQDGRDSDGQVPESGEWADEAIGPRLGEVLSRLEEGSDTEAATEAFRFAVEWCLENGCHHAVIELGTRGLKVARPDEGDWWQIVHAVAMAMAALRREGEAEELLMRARAQTTSSAWHSTINYTLAMLYTRHHDPAARDLDKALGWVNAAIAICELLPDPPNRAVKLGFDLNGKALIETRRGNPEEAMRLVQRAIDLADRDLEPDAQPIHRLVLKANRAQLHVKLGNLDAALADLDAVIAADPGYPDYYLDRGNLLHRLGRDDDALADYTTALAVGPPFPEPHFNRAEIHFARGDHDRALADLDRAITLDPDFLDARINRAGLLVELEQYGRARADVEAGLVLDPANAHLHCALGQIAMAEGDADRARSAFDTALSTAPELAEAWASRGMLAFEQGNPAAAVDDLTAALRLGESAALLYNRAIALRATGRPERAAADLKRALELAPDDEDIQRELTAHA